MRSLMQALGDPQDAFPSIHVTGTNGKGSVSVSVASILAKGGRRVGLTTSPHLQRINERIVIDGRPIEDELLDRCGAEVMRAAADLPEQPTFFEGITAAAFLAFKISGVDFAVVEVGLGGRLDATNVLRSPKTTVIVTIDFDHEQILGSTLGEIAREKAGIVKSGAALIVGRVGDEAREAIGEAARVRDVKPLMFGSDFGIRNGGGGSLLYFDDEEEFPIRPSLLGDHQQHNMAVAIAAARSVGATVEECQAGVADVVWPGRLEVITFGGRDIIIDAAHNPAGVASLIAFLKSRGVGPSCAFGAIDTKNWRVMVENLIPNVADWTILEPEFPKAVPAHEIVAFLSGFGIKARAMGRDYAAFRDELGQGTQPVLIAGSIYLIGIIRDLVASGGQPLWRMKTK